MHRLAVLRLICAPVVALSLWTCRHAAAQSIRDDFFVTNGRVEATALAGNTLYIGGTFSQVGPLTGSGVPIDATTGLPVAGFPEVTGFINDAAPDGSGGWFIAGNITAVNGVPRTKVAHIMADNSLAPWNPTPNLTVISIAVSGSTVYLAGGFTTVNGVTRLGVAAVDAVTGTLKPWNPSASGALAWTLEVNDTTVYVAGPFAAIGGQARQNIAALGATSGLATSWNPGVNGDVWDIAVSGTTVYAAGNFTMIGGQSRNRLAAISAVTGAATAWDPNPDGTDVFTVVPEVGTVYVGGNFTTIGGQTRNRIAAIHSVSGLAVSWDANATGSHVASIRVSGATMYVAGSFSSIGGQTRTNIAALDFELATATSWNPNANNNVRALVVSGSTVYAGGNFTSLGGQFRSRIAAIDVTTGMVTGWNPTANGTSVSALAVTGTTVYAGGDFTMIGSQARNRIAEISAATGLATGWDPNADGTVRTIVRTPSAIYAGGDFGMIGGQPRSRIAALDPGSGLATAWDPNATGTRVDALAVNGPTVYAGGVFSMIGGQARNRLAALDLGTGLATSWNPAPTGTTVRALAVSGSTVYAGGDFTMIGGQTRNRIAALDAATGLATTWNPNANGTTLRALAVSGGTVYAGGDFTTIGGQTRRQIAALSASSGLATGWNVPGNLPNGSNPTVYALSANGTAVFMGAETVNGFVGQRGITAIDEMIPPAPFNSTWHGHTSLYPDAFCPWNLFDTASPEDPALAGGVLTLATSSASENLYYEQTQFVTAPDTLVIEARFRVVSETHLAGNPRRGVGIGFLTAPNSGNFLWVARDTVFIWSGLAVQGATAFVDTDDDFHDYRIEVLSSSTIRVYQDNVQILTGSILTDAAFAGTPQLHWGDITLSSSAVSEWVYVQHNVSPSPCGSVSAAGTGSDRPGETGPAVTIRPWPNPARGPLTLGLLAAEGSGGPADLEIYDVSGRILSRIEIGTLPQGLTTVRWNGTDDRGAVVPNGMYFMRLESAGRLLGSGRVMILK